MRNTDRASAALTRSVLSPGRGILLLDEHAGHGSTAAARDTQGLVDAVLTAPGIEQHVSAVLVSQRHFDASAQARRLRELSAPALPLHHGVLMRPRDVEAHRDDVRRTLAENLRAGAALAEWRAHVSPLEVPRGGVHVDAPTLAAGVAASQAEEVLPVVTVAMPDLATQSAAVTRAATANALRSLVAELDRRDVDLGRLLLRVNVVRAGQAHPHRTSPAEAAAATLAVIEETVPPEVAGVAFLSGGRSLTEAVEDLAALVSLARSTGSGSPERRVTFAFTRALLAPAAGVPELQRDLVARCRLAAQALTSARSAAAPESSASA